MARGAGGHPGLRVSYCMVESDLGSGENELQVPASLSPDPERGLCRAFPIPCFPMNKHAPFLCLLGFSLGVLPVSAVDLTGDNLILGDDNTVTWAPEPAKSAVLGISNTINGIENLIVGEGNQMPYAILNMILGSSNSQVSETLNDTVLSVGHNNVFGGCGDAAIFGSSNYVALSSGFLAGFGNSLEGSLQFGLGQGLINHANNGQLSLYLGQYNAAAQGSTSPLLVVGKGTGPSSRANALEIARDGKAKLTNSVEIFAPNYNAANTNSGKIVIQPSTSGSSLTIDGRPVLTSSPNGNVGIGLANPGHLLDLGNAFIDDDGSASFAGGAVTLGSYGLASPGAEFGNSGSLGGFWLYPGYITGDSVAGVNTTDGSATFANGQFIIDSSGGGLVSGILLFAPTQAGVTYISGTGSPDNNTDFLNLGTGHGGLVIRDGDYNQDYMTVLGSGSSHAGYVGIGTSSPQARLTVNGNAALGTGLVSAGDQIVLGKYNDTRTNDGGVDHTQGILIVGAGTGPGSSAANAIRVLNDGTVLVKKSGNLSMGSFTNGPRP